MERLIKIPSPISFIDPNTNEPAGETLTFRAFILKLMDNPKWVQSYRMLKSADAITKALEAALVVKSSEPVMVIDEKDWEHLADAVENPKAIHIAQNGLSSLVPGFGLHPRVAAQLLPFCDAIMHAPQEDPLLRKKAV